MRRLIFILPVLVLLVACNKTESSKESIFVSILPQKYFADRIVGDLFDVEVMVAPGSNPATYEPTPRQMSKLGRSKLFYAIGVPFEQAWIPKIQKNYPELFIEDTSVSIRKRPMDESASITEEEHHDIHEQDGHHEHGHIHKPGSRDPHVWLDPEYAKVISRTMFQSLSNKYPEHNAEFKSNYDLLVKDLDSLSNDLAEVLDGVESRNLLVFHPSWGYLADRYGFRQIPIEIDNRNPTAKETAQTVEFAKHKEIKYIFINSQVDSSQAEKIAEEIGAKVISIDPLAYDYIDNLKKVATVISGRISE